MILTKPNLISCMIVTKVFLKMGNYFLFWTISEIDFTKEFDFISEYNSLTKLVVKITNKF